jgi:hypothetical protein
MEGIIINIMSACDPTLAHILVYRDKRFFLKTLHIDKAAMKAEVMKKKEIKDEEFLTELISQKSSSGVIENVKSGDNDLYIGRNKIFSIDKEMTKQSALDNSLIKFENIFQVVDNGEDLYPMSESPLVSFE